MDICFPDKTVLVTGGGHGFGRAIAHGFAARGAKVWTCDIDESGLAETKRAAPGLVETAVLDITDRAALNRYVDSIVAARGRVDVLVNNAGGVCGQVFQPLEQITLDQWEVVFKVNVTAAFNFAQATAPGMKQAGKGRIVNISSGAGLQASLTGIQAYCSAKHALVGLTRQLCQELGPFGITVNSVAPGFVRSNPSSEKQWQSYGPDGQKRLVERIALRRLGNADDIANAVLFFASDHAGWVSGQILQVNGGT
ncbi:MAG: SDR family oxidoreductase [Alphaproteobacteria bacterium]|nr:SDR family oxidoreductase [Alphaproteobacteria bacterium]